MALSTAKHEKFYETSGSGADKVSTKDLADVTASWALDKAEGCKALLGDPFLGPLVYQLQQMQDELDYLRTEISTNKDKATFPGFGTSGSTALVGNTALLALGTSGSTALAGDTKIVGYVGSSDTNITIGNMASAIVKGQTVYTLPITVTQSGTDKLGNPTTLTKTATLTLA